MAVPEQFRHHGSNNQVFLNDAQRGILPENLAKINRSVLLVNGWNFL